jgi:conjugative transposon TraM protein
MDALKKINWKQGKYILPLILYIPILFIGYFVIDLFHTEKADVPDKNLTTTEYLNPVLPEAQMKGDGIGNKYESMVKSYGKIDDYSAMENIDRNEEDEKETYDSRYTDDERNMLESEEAAKLAEMERQLQASAQKGNEIGEGQGVTDASRSQQREQDAMAELDRALAQARLQGQQATNVPAEVPADTGNLPSNKAEGTININERAVNGISEDDEAQEVVKKVKVTSDYFNTLAENDPEPNLIKAIIDEDVKAVDGSRVRLRLLDDIEINETVVPKGTYIYALMSGFGSQRVKGNIKSILINDNIIKVNLSLYDTDGLEGLYVPSSNFRETTKDVASGAMSNTSSLTSSSSTTGNSLIQWGNQAISNAVQKTSNAISKSIKKNTAKLKYGTFVYLINGKEKKNN